jgi:hypothetical protein
MICNEAFAVEARCGLMDQLLLRANRMSRLPGSLKFMRIREIVLPLISELDLLRNDKITTDPFCTRNMQTSVV